jgi:UDP-N-acetylmuramyl pentapeptide phosphotransferase/UDP-N-acetylglucosamine-1-phosphate transferase
VIAVVGAVDDLRSSPVVPRFAMQAMCILAILISLPPEFQIVPAAPLSLERAFLLLAALWFVNLTNLLDGLDWITVAEVVPITAAPWRYGTAAGLPYRPSYSRQRSAAPCRLRPIQ